MYSKAALLLVLAQAFAAPVELEERQSCPKIHVFGARETTASPGYGSTARFVNDILSAYPGSTAEAISYPACGGQSSCGGDSYAQSVQAGVKAVQSQVSSFASRCPSTQLVYVGHSQGSQIGDDTLCGGGDPNNGVTNTAATIAQYNFKAIIWTGDPRFVPGESFHVGSATHGGFAARPAAITCGKYQGLIQSYCDSGDEYCSNGSNPNTHNQYQTEYGSAALAFVKSKLTA
ncbi:carbohydrate esterase [Elasticomyces elasticus]|nr:carbohydrate esterase [Elasticomyces elasticus]KAK4933482.1 carbohydrate esterase [Elasticomyces elasticus]KAK5756413.1 carbohydrate esterase [Elasticomyces elasticus]